VINLKNKTMFRKLKRTWSHGYTNYIPNLTKVFPELSKIDSEELCNRLIELKLDFYHEEQVPVKLCMRLTLPFAILVFISMFLALPLVFLITGKWSYSLGEKNIILNWFRALRLQ
jgi:hypothetical protein